MSTTRRSFLAAAVIFFLAVLRLGQAEAADPHASFYQLVSGNGFVVTSFNVEDASRRMDAYLEHPYRYWDEDTASTQTRDLCYDSYFGARVGGSATWLTEVPISQASYLSGTGIIEVVQAFSGLTFRTYLFAPFEPQDPMAVIAVRVENESGSDSEPVSLFWIGNFHLGSGRPEPGTDGERIVWDQSSYAETGAGGAAMVYQPLPAPDHHACSPNNPYPVVPAGADLVDTDDSGLFDDAVAGFQWDKGVLAHGEDAWASVVMGNHFFGNAAEVRAAIAAYVGARSTVELLSDEEAGWQSWITAPPVSLSADARALWVQSEVVLRMGQVREPGAPHGQILASLPPGNWNIAWVRDMCYAVVGLARSGHAQEAWDALEFMLEADAGHYQDYVGRPYKISVTRYFGSGLEESDWNADGPNIEFDGFGLFLWALGEVVRVWPQAPWSPYWPVIRDEIAEVLLSLQDPGTGIIQPDSSIWEVHWNGRQKRYTYTSLSAARGLCAASDMAAEAGENERAEAYRQASQSIREALLAHSVDPDDVLAQSYEELSGNLGYMDAAVVEAINWGLVRPDGDVTNATLDAMLLNMRPPSGNGFFRNDDGGWYDSQEWVFVDLRAALAFFLAGRAAVAADLVSWITAQARYNFNLIAELHDASTADYQGEVPMVGFGAGGYIIVQGRMLEDPPSSPPCGTYADVPDGGALPDGSISDASADGAAAADGGGGGGGGDKGCDCRAARKSLSFHEAGQRRLLVFLLLLACFAVRAKRLRNIGR